MFFLIFLTRQYTVCEWRGPFFYYYEHSVCVRKKDHVMCGFLFYFLELKKLFFYVRILREVLFQTMMRILNILASLQSCTARQSDIPRTCLYATVVTLHAEEFAGDLTR